MTSPASRNCLLTALVLLLGLVLSHADEFRVATYNLENYVDAETPARPLKSTEAKAKIRESIRAMQPDVLALEEIGSISALQELRDSLKTDGLEFPYWEHVSGFDTNIHVAVLSKFPFIARRSHTNDQFLLNGRRFHVSRGFAEVDIRVGTNFSFTLIAAHLKSKRVVPEEDQADLRLEEAKLLRERIDARLAAEPNANLIVLGDLNDSRDSPPIKTIIGRGKHKLTDTRPAERNGDQPEASRRAIEPRNVTWTEYFAKEDSYNRIDYILLSPHMARFWITGDTYVLAAPNWGVGSDHRPLVTAFDPQAK